MVTLLDGIIQFFTDFGDKTDEDKASNAIAVLQAIEHQAQLNLVSSIFPPAVLAMPSVQLAYNATTNRITVQKDRGLFGPVAGAVYEGFKDLEPEIAAAVMATLTGGLTTAAPAAEALAGAILQPILDMIITTLEAAGQQVPGDVRSKLGGVLLPVLSLGLTLEVASDLAELIQPMKNMGLSGAAHFLHDTCGFTALTESYIYPVRKALIEQPTIYNINRLTQPYYPDSGNARMLVWKRLITADQYADILRVHGTREDYLNAFQAGVWRELSMRDLQRLYDVDSVPDDFARQAIRYTGFKDADVEILLAALKKRVIIKDVGDIRTLQRSQYKTGRITKDAYLQLLQERNITGQDAQDLINAVDAEVDFEAREEDRALYEKKFLDGRANADDLTAALKRLNKTDDFITARVARLTEQRLGKLKVDTADKVLSRADILKQYTLGKISRAAAIQALDDSGWTTNDAIALVDLEDAAALEKVQTETIRAAEQRAKDLRMSLTDLIAVYVANGKSQAWADARGSYINEVVQGKSTTSTEVTTPQ